MKKNRMMRVASALLIAVLLTTCTISGTFAKYVTSDSASDTARVAKWGVEVAVEGTLFGTNYFPNSKDETSDKISAAAKQSVDTAPGGDGKNIVAPGTQSDEGFSFSLNGVPEVRTSLDVKITSENIYLKAGTYAVMVLAPTVTEDNFKTNTYYTFADNTYTLAKYYDATAGEYYIVEDMVTLSRDYYPVVYSVDLTSGSIASDSLNAIAADYANKLNSGELAAENIVLVDGKTTYTIHDKKYDANYNYANLQVAAETLTWKWDFEQSTDKEMYNGADTIIGNLQAGAKVVRIDANDINEGIPQKATAPVSADVASDDIGHYNLETEFSISITVTQVD